jgi:hypothetical protein
MRLAVLGPLEVEPTKGPIGPATKPPPSPSTRHDLHGDRLIPPAPVNDGSAGELLAGR